KAQDIDMIEAIESKSEKTSNLIEIVSKLSVNGESKKVQDLIKELFISREPNDNNDKKNKIRKLNLKTLFQLYYNTSQAEKHITRAYQEEIRCWYLFAEKFKEKVKEIKNNNSRFNNQQAKGTNSNNKGEYYLDLKIQIKGKKVYKDWSLKKVLKKIYNDAFESIESMPIFEIEKIFKLNPPLNDNDLKYFEDNL
ncbi:2537_t:CDS:2, partial [Racocetra persica]